MVPRLPADIAGFVQELTSATLAKLGGDLIGLWVVGSIATGDARGPDSDVDVLVAVAEPLGEARGMALAEAVVALGRRCPWAGIEYVVYPVEVLAAPAYPLAYDLNVNAGPQRDVLVSSGGDPPHWFLLDVSMARQHALAVVGPPASEVLGEPARHDVAAALLDALRWHADNEAASTNTVLNACRSWCWLETGCWRSKTAAGKWALAKQDHQAVVAAALARRAGDIAWAPPRGAVGALLATVTARAKDELRGG